jgi:hypothetical protein
MENIDFSTFSLANLSSPLRLKKHEMSAYPL